MKTKILLILLALSSLNLTVSAREINIAENNNYTLIIEGFDWGPHVSKVVLHQTETLKTSDFKDYTVDVNRSSDCMEMPAAQQKGSRTVLYAYVSDTKGNIVKEGNNITLVLAVGPNQPLGSAIQYSPSGKCRGNIWIKYELKITNTKSNNVWNKESNRIKPLCDEFDLSGKYEYETGKLMSYASFKPRNNNAKAPLIIWLHGGGEGGTDPSIAILGNKVVNYASEEIQSYFGGAYILAPQSPGAWMHDKTGAMQPGSGEDVYNVGLLALIKDFVNKHPDIDKKRIYLGGCSNGGYMTLKLLIKDPNYFAAAYISSLAYHSQYISDAQINSVKHIPSWYVHSKDDMVTKPDLTVVPVYERLKKAGAKNLHFSFYDHVTDLSGFYGGQNYHYNGHWSWVYLHANQVKLDFDNKPVMMNGRAVTIFEWLAAQKKR